MTKNPHPTDVHVGQNIRRYRLAKGITQAVLAGDLGMSFQQVQKYETGMNRVSASVLYQIANALGVPVGWFFDGLTDEPTMPVNPAEMNLLKHYRGLCESHRLQIAKLMRVMAETPVQSSEQAA